MGLMAFLEVEGLLSSLLDVPESKKHETSYLSRKISFKVYEGNSLWCMWITFRVKLGILLVDLGVFLLQQ